MTRDRSGARVVVGVGAALALVAGAAKAATGTLPPLLATASAERLPGKMVFAELVTPDLDGAERFYGGLFGWTFKEVPVRDTRYAEAIVNGAQVAGLIQKPIPPGGGRRPSWLTFFATADVDATTDVATHYGARVLFAPRAAAGLGREAVLADPQGAVFALLASSSGDPPDVLVDDGAWIWSSLITNDPNTAAGFYRALFGYQVFAAPEGGGKHLVMASNDYARASVNPFPADRPDDRARWTDFVRVEDVGSAVAKAVSLGGTVLVPAHGDREGDPVAIVADPQGAAFGLLQWSSVNPQENAK